MYTLSRRPTNRPTAVAVSEMTIPCDGAGAVLEWARLTAVANKDGGSAEL